MTSCLSVMHRAARIWTWLFMVGTVLTDGNGPIPKVIPASQYFEGNDGPWSTFDLRVGTPEQDIRVLVSTASPQSIVPLSDYGCSEAVFDTVPSDCAVSRGNLFSPNDSSSWQDLGTYGINQNGVGLEANLGYEVRAQFGLDQMAVGFTGPSLKNQTLAGIATPEPFYLGVFGLNSQPVNLSSLGNQSAASFLTTLHDEGEIPSLAWGYTAGAKYRLKQVYGQLIFSGYDSSRLTENSVSFTMAEDLTRDLVVVLQSISYRGTNSATLLSEPIDIFIDSTDPNIWLPGDVCDAFEEAFGLSLDDESDLYLVNETHHNDLLDSDAEVSFRLSDVSSGGETVTIILPYAAFDLTAEYPLVENSSYYFPLKRADNETQYTLGRTFLQEAYLSADYERKVFNVSACAWNEGAEEHIVTITSKDSDSSTTGGSAEDGSSSNGSGLGSGKIAGIAVGSAVAGIALVIAIAIVILRKRRKWLGAGFAMAGAGPAADEAVIKGPVFNSEPRSTPEGSVPMSADDISAPTRSNGTHSASAADSSTRPAAIKEYVAGISTPELDGDGTNIRPDTELDGKELQEPVAETTGVHELPGSEAAHGNGAKKRHDPPFIIGGLPRDNGERGGNEPPSPAFVSPIHTTWDTTEGDVSDLISPTTPTRSEN